MRYDDLGVETHAIGNVGSKLCWAIVDSRASCQAWLGMDLAFTFFCLFDEFLLQHND